VRKDRPVNLNLFTIHFPIPAIVSILHRISGVILFLFIPFMLWGLNVSLKSEQDFTNLQASLKTSMCLKVWVWCVLAAFIFHFVAGIRHLLMDVHIGDELKSGRVSAYLTFIISILLMILAGIWLW
jgi:succinate dehydrogenase / fumarate reductase cytochrome b subunit